MLRQEEGSETISKAALLQFLQHEYEVSVCSGPAALHYTVNTAVEVAGRATSSVAMCR